MTASSPPLILVSACLLGQATRYDGRHKLLPGLTDAILAAGARPLPFCAEFEAGLPVPRPPMNLIPTPLGLRLQTRDGTDHTALLQRWIDRTLTALQTSPPAACILKTKSPSCGIHPPHPGLFAAALAQTFPNIPLLDEHTALPFLRSRPFR